MSISGLCQVCESREAEHSCSHCGTAVCDEHYDRSKGLCVRCIDTSGRDDVSPTTDGVDEDDVHQI